MARGAHEKPRRRTRFDFSLADFLGGAIVEALYLLFLLLAILTAVD